MVQDVKDEKGSQRHVAVLSEDEIKAFLGNDINNPEQPDTTDFGKLSYAQRQAAIESRDVFFHSQALITFITSLQKSPGLSFVDSLTAIEEIWKEKGFMHPKDLHTKLLERVFDGTGGETLKKEILKNASNAAHVFDRFLGYDDKAMYPLITSLAHYYSQTTGETVTFGFGDFSNVGGTNNYNKKQVEALVDSEIKKLQEVLTALKRPHTQTEGLNDPNTALAHYSTIKTVLENILGTVPPDINNIVTTGHYSEDFITKVINALKAAKGETAGWLLTDSAAKMTAGVIKVELDKITHLYYGDQYDPERHATHIMRIGGDEMGFISPLPQALLDRALRELIYPKLHEVHFALGLGGHQHSKKEAVTTGFSIAIGTADFGEKIDLRTLIPDIDRTIKRAKFESGLLRGDKKRPGSSQEEYLQIPSLVREALENNIREYLIYKHDILTVKDVAIIRRERVYEEAGKQTRKETLEKSPEITEGKMAVLAEIDEQAKRYVDIYIKDHLTPQYEHLQGIAKEINTLPPEERYMAMMKRLKSENFAPYLRRGNTETPTLFKDIPYQMTTTGGRNEDGTWQIASKGKDVEVRLYEPLSTRYIMQTLALLNIEGIYDQRILQVFHPGFVAKATPGAPEDETTETPQGLEAARERVLQFIQGNKLENGFETVFGSDSEIVRDLMESTQFEDKQILLIMTILAQKAGESDINEKAPSATDLYVEAVSIIRQINAYLAKVSQFRSMCPVTGLESTARTYETKVSDVMKATTHDSTRNEILTAQDANIGIFPNKPILAKIKVENLGPFNLFSQDGGDAVIRHSKELLQEAFAEKGLSYWFKHFMSHKGANEYRFVLPPLDAERKILFVESDKERDALKSEIENTHFSQWNVVSVEEISASLEMKINGINAQNAIEYLGSRGVSVDPSKVEKYGNLNVGDLAHEKRRHEKGLIVAGYSKPIDMDIYQGERGAGQANHDFSEYVDKKEIAIRKAWEPDKTMKLSEQESKKIQQQLLRQEYLEEAQAREGDPHLDRELERRLREQEKVNPTSDQTEEWKEKAKKQKFTGSKKEQKMAPGVLGSIPHHIVEVVNISGNRLGKGTEIILN